MADAQAHAADVLASLDGDQPAVIGNAGMPEPAEIDSTGSPMGAAVSSFVFFAGGALIPVLPYIFGMSGLPAVLLSAGLVGLALLATGALVGLLSGVSPLTRALRQLAIGWGAAAITYVLGLAFGATLG